MNITFMNSATTDEPMIVIHNPSAHVDSLMHALADGKPLDDATIRMVREQSEAQKQCVCCLTPLEAKWYVISYTVASLLKAMYNDVLEAGVNIVDLKALEARGGITYNEKSASSIARFHGLIAKRKVNGVHVPNEWVITTRGAQFLRNIIKLPRKVKVYRNRVVDHWHEEVSVIDILGNDPRVAATLPFERDLATADDINLSEAKRS